MIIAQYPAAGMTQVAFTASATTQITAVSSVGGQSNGVAAGFANLAVGKGFTFGLPFKLIMQGNATVLTTTQTIKMGFNLGTAAWLSGAKPATMFETIDGTGISATAGKHTFALEAVLYADALTQTVSGTYSTSYDSTAVLKQILVTQATGLTLPTFTSPYSWPATITGLDTAISNAPFLFIVPEVSVSATGTGTINYTSLVVTQE